jgi:hypothetical protein
MILLSITFYGLVAVAVRDGSGIAGEFHIVGAVGDDVFTGFEAGEDDGACAVGVAEFHLSFLEGFGFYLYVHEVESLVFGDGAVGEGEDFSGGLTEEVDFGVGAGNEVAYVIELEDDGYEGGVVVSALAVGDESSVEVLEAEGGVGIVGRNEVGSGNVAELGEA